MPGITNCEFMVKGYHYTEPTTPARTDSCRLYLDTSIDGEASSIGNEIWDVPSTAYLDIPFNKFSEEIGNVSGGTTSKQSPVFTNVFSNLENNDIFVFENLPDGVTTNTPITLNQILQNYSSSSLSGPENITTPSAIIFYYTGGNDPHLRCVLGRSSSDASFSNIIIRVVEKNNFRRLHLKGIHGFYVQT